MISQPFAHWRIAAITGVSPRSLEATARGVAFLTKCPPKAPNLIDHGAELLNEPDNAAKFDSLARCRDHGNDAGRAALLATGRDRATEPDESGSDAPVGGWAHRGCHHRCRTAPHADLCSHGG